MVAGQSLFFKHHRDIKKTSWSLWIQVVRFNSTVLRWAAEHYELLSFSCSVHVPNS